MPSVRGQVKTAGAAARADIEIDSQAFMRSLVAAVKALEVRTEAELWTLGLRVQNNARILAPVDTGRLRSSIQVTKGRDGGGSFVEIAAGVFYAVFVEFGTTRAAAQPFLRPAIAIAATQWGQGLGVKGGVS